MLALLDRLTPDKRVLIGLILGLGLMIPAAGLRSLAFGRWLADPMPLLLSIGQLLRGGFAQFNWQGPLIFLLFLLMAVILAVSAAWRLGWHGDDAGVIARTIMLLNVGVVLVRQTDAIMVGIWYLLSLILSLVLAATLANKLSHWTSRERKELP